MVALRKSCLLVAVAVLALAAVWAGQGNDAWRGAAALGALLAPIGIGAIPALASYQYTSWIVGVVVAALAAPGYFLQIGPFDLGGVHVGALDLRASWLVMAIVQLVMFGMGTKMSLRDFAGVAKMPGPVLVGVTLQFTVMPLTGFALAKACGLPPEIGAGIILIGSCSSGLASNVMCYLAGANLPLSITLTAVATLLAPLMTPFWMRLLAGEVVERSFLAMAVDIIKMTIVPIGAAMVHDALKTPRPELRRTILAAAAACAAALLVLVLVATRGASGGEGAAFNPNVILAIYCLAAPIVGVAYHYAVVRWSWIDRHMHVVSMFGIIYFTAVTTAAGRDNLLQAGVVLCLAAVLHNAIGYAAGYGISRAVGLDRQSALTVGFEVGMQNGGMAAGLAASMHKLGTLGLAAAVFSPWMNVSGSLWANYLRRKSRAAADEPAIKPVASDAAALSGR